jgi:hypothetical protein
MGRRAPTASPSLLTTSADHRAFGATDRHVRPHLTPAASDIPVNDLG